MSVKGLIAFPITPMDGEGKIDATAFGYLVARLVGAGVDGVGALGSTGSYPFLTRDERRRALDVAVAAADGRVPILAGVGHLRTNQAILSARDAKAAGVRVGLLAPMSYIPLTDEEVFEHFSAVAREGGLPICIYNNPIATHFTMSEALISRLSVIPGVVALKTPAPPAEQVADCVAGLRKATPNSFAVGFSTDLNVTEALIAGGDAWYSVLAGIWPEPCIEIVRAVGLSDIERARMIDARLKPIWELFRKLTSLRVVYATARVLGLAQADPPRPILPLSGAAVAEVEAVMTRVGFGGSVAQWG